jgi:hypothetical protein
LALCTAGRGPCHARRNGFDLQAAVLVPGRDRARLERVCRYALRPPVAHDRIRLTDQGQVLLELRHRWADGTTQLHPTAHNTRGGDPGLRFDPVELLERLAALTPRPRINLLLYYGVLAARSAWRSRLGGPQAAPGPRQTGAEPVAGPGAAVAATRSPRGPSNLLWAQLMQRSFGFDVLACARCGGRLRLIALIDEPGVIRRMLSHLGLPTEVPAVRPSRAPPITLDSVPDHAEDDTGAP